MYHYTSHNSINQTFSVGPVSHERIGLLRYAYEHANEELGHEKMVKHDLESIGLLTPWLLSGPPLPATRRSSATCTPSASGRGRWRGSGTATGPRTPTPTIDELLHQARKDLDLTDKETSFFVAHSMIDARHADEVREAVRRHVQGPEEMQQVVEVARTTLYMTGRLLDNALEEHLAHA